jgi:FixJ family two-component response regulator
MATVSNHRIPMVLITACDDEATRQRALKGAAVDLLRKPIRREALLSAVHLALQQNDGRRCLYYCQATDRKKAREITPPWRVEI